MAIETIQLQCRNRIASVNDSIDSNATNTCGDSNRNRSVGKNH